MQKEKCMKLLGKNKNKCASLQLDAPRVSAVVIAPKGLLQSVVLARRTKAHPFDVIGQLVDSRVVAPAEAQLGHVLRLLVPCDCKVILAVRYHGLPIRAGGVEVVHIADNDVESFRSAHCDVEPLRVLHESVPLPTVLGAAELGLLSLDAAYDDDLLLPALIVLHLPDAHLPHFRASEDLPHLEDLRPEGRDDRDVLRRNVDGLTLQQLRDEVLDHVALVVIEQRRIVDLIHLLSFARVVE
mmetsp:Transcript_22263/g.41848  ORF Transcript_22263/g.41848 Transcript_22263/m.41848 type:complete len:241 (+) Transcript_22263:317-1039(+)